MSESLEARALIACEFPVSGVDIQVLDGRHAIALDRGEVFATRFVFAAGADASAAIECSWAGIKEQFR